MRIEIKVTGAPISESDVLAAHAFESVVREWIKSNSDNGAIEVRVSGIIYRRGAQIGNYDPVTGEASYHSGKEPAKPIIHKD